MIRYGWIGSRKLWYLWNTQCRLGIDRNFGFVQVMMIIEITINASSAIFLLKGEVTDGCDYQPPFLDE
jgi:hypothetical protein